MANALAADGVVTAPLLSYNEISNPFTVLLCTDTYLPSSFSSPSVITV